MERRSCDNCRHSRNELVNFYNGATGTKVTCEENIEPPRAEGCGEYQEKLGHQIINFIKNALDTRSDYEKKDAENKYRMAMSWGKEPSYADGVYFDPKTNTYIGDGVIIENGEVIYIKKEGDGN